LEKRAQNWAQVCQKNLKSVGEFDPKDSRERSQGAEKTAVRARADGGRKRGSKKENYNLEVPRLSPTFNNSQVVCSRVLRKGVTKKKFNYRQMAVNRLRKGNGGGGWFAKHRTPKDRKKQKAVR